MLGVEEIDGLKMASRWPQWSKIDPRQSKHGPTQTNMAPKGNLVGPKEPQERPKLLGAVSRWPQDGHPITRDGLKMASQCADLSQEGLKMATR